MAIDLSSTKDEYEGTDELLDRKTTGAIVTLARRIRPTLRAGVFADWRRTTSTTRTWTTRSAATDSTSRGSLGHATELSFQYDNSRRDASADLRG